MIPRNNIPGMVCVRILPPSQVLSSHWDATGFQRSFFFQNGKKVANSEQNVFGKISLVQTGATGGGGGGGMMPIFSLPCVRHSDKWLCTSLKIGLQNVVCTTRVYIANNPMAVRAHRSKKLQ